MNEIIINPSNLNEKDISKIEKVRALLFNENNCLLIAKYNNIYLLPGGKIERNETVEEGLIRELNEELGTIFSFDDLEYFMTLKHFQKDFPGTYGDYLDRLVTTYFYTGFLNIDLDKVKNSLSLKEKQGSFSLQYIDLDDLEKLILTYKTTNPRAPFFDFELLTAYYEINRKENLKKRIRIK